MLLSLQNPDGSKRYSVDQITGMFISLMFAGHHTTSGTAAWTLIELLKHPDVLAGVVSSSTRCTPTGARSAIKRCARSRASSTRSWKRCASTRR